MNKMLSFCKGLVLTGLILSISSDLKAQKTAAGKQQMETKIGNYTSFTPKETADVRAWAKFNKETSKHHPEFGKLPFNGDYKGYVEVLDKRKEDERYFVNESKPTEFYIQKAYGALHLKKDGNWVTINHHITNKGNGIYEADEQLDAVGFDVNKATSYIKTPNGIVYFNNWQLYGHTAGTQDNILATANWSTYTAGDDGLYVTNIFPGIDAQMEVNRGSVKTSFIVKKLNYSGYTDLIFQDNFKAPYASALNFRGDAAGSSHAVSEAELKTGSTSLVQIGAAIVGLQGGAKEKAFNAEYVIEDTKLGISIPLKWIKDNINSSNIIIDPLVTSSNTLAQASITGSQYNASCTFANSCDYNLVVNTPPMATFTDIQWSFAYKAAGLCYEQDGSMTFQIGGNACQSPVYTGNTATQTYWFCNAIGAGTCTGTNVSIFSDIGSCLPAPTCLAQPVTFTMNFYRSCWGAAGCASGCISANAPWIMAIQGHTLEFTNTSTPVTVSSSSVCLGQTVTATTATQYGVAPRTTNWSFSSTGIPSVGSGTTTAIGFPSAGTYTVYGIITDACAQTVSSNQVVTVAPQPTITVNSDSICVGGTTTLTANGGTSYTWNPTTALTPSTGSVVASNPTSTTIYTVTGAAAGCSATATSTVAIRPAVVITATSATVCSGATATLTVSGASTYTWSPATGLSATTGSMVTVTNPTATIVYSIIGANSAGCTGTTTSTVTVNPSPVVTVNSATICLGDSATLTATGATTYSWSPITGLNSSSSGVVKASPTTQTIYTVTGTTVGCFGTATSTVSVASSPTITVNSATICLGDSAILTATGATTYSWSPITGLNSSSTGVVKASPATQTIYTVTGNIGVCAVTPATSTVSVNTLPTVNVNSASFCAGDSATLTATGATNYIWSPAGGLSASSGNPVTAKPTTSINYTVTGIDGNGCTDTAVAIISISASPTITVTSATVCVGDTAILTVSGATSYTWNPSTALNINTVGDTAKSGALITTTYSVTGTIGICSDTKTVMATVIPAVTITVTSSANPICVGGSATLTATGATTYTWTVDPTLSTATGSVTVATPTLNPTSYTVSGSVGTCSAIAGVITVSVTPNPTLTVSNDTAICIGSTVTLTATGAISYVWGTSTVTPIAATASVAVTPTATQTYYVIGNPLSCPVLDSVKITVNATPTVTASSNPTAICAAQQTATLTAIGAATYTWNPSVNLSSPTGSVVTTNNTIISSANYTVTGTDGNGCVGIGTVSLTVNQPSPISVTSTSICIGGTATLTATGANTTYTWSTGANGATITPSPTTTTTYTVAGIDANTCASFTTAIVTVNNLPTVTAASGATPCIGTSTSLTANGAVTYTWNPTTGLSSPNGSPVSLTPTSTTAVTYTVSGTDANGCINYTTTTVFANPKPTVSATVDASTICKGNSVNLTATGAVNYTWTPAATLTGANTATPIGTPSTNTTYTVRGADVNGCVNTFVVPTVTVSNINAAISADPTTGDAPLTVVFTNSSTGATTYTWNYGNGNSQVTTSTSVGTQSIYQTAGTYTVTMIAANATCQAPPQSVIIIVNEGFSISIPNIFTPNGDGINDNFFVKSSGVSTMDIMILDRWGLKMWESSSASGMWDGRNGSKEANDGTYFYIIKVTDTKNVSTDYKGHLTLIR